MTSGKTDVPRIIVALDYPCEKQAIDLVDRLSPEYCGLKVGKELFTTAGPQFVRRLVQSRYAVFLDLKFHDIPNTVARAVSAAADLGVWMVNVHASGGVAMMEAAIAAAHSVGKHRPLVTAVTVLTSMSSSDLKSIGITSGVQQQVELLAGLADASGLDGVVCSANEAAMLRKKHPDNFVLVTPGIRLAAAAIQGDDQHRTMSPREAIDAGADYLVIGRPVTQSINPIQTLLTIKEDISYIHS